MTILIVEDDAAINQLIAEILKSGGYSPIQAYSGTEGKMVLETTSVSMVILDLMLPGLSGEELVPIIRKRQDIPILILSAKDSPSDKVSLLRLGADDYLTKPFDDEELLARIEALMRRAASGGNKGGKSEILSYKDIELNQESREVKKGDKTLVLTAREFDILHLLFTNPNKVFTKSNLYQSVWNDEFYGDDNTVNVHISNLRGKLGEGEYIQTVWGIGFKLYDL